MDKEKLELLIKYLEHIREKPLMYISDQPHAVVDFLNGFNAASAFFGFSSSDNNYQKTYEQVVLERGWERSSKAPWHQMEQRKISNHDIMYEMLTIKIEVLRRLQSGSSKE